MPDELKTEGRGVMNWIRKGWGPGDDCQPKAGTHREEQDIPEGEALLAVADRRVCCCCRETAADTVCKGHYRTDGLREQ